MSFFTSTGPKLANNVIAIIVNSLFTFGTYHVMI